MYTVVIERKIGNTQFVTFSGRASAEKMVDRAKLSTNVISATLRLPQKDSVDSDDVDLVETQADERQGWGRQEWDEAQAEERAGWTP